MSEEEQTVLWLRHWAGVRRSGFTAINSLFVFISHASVFPDEEEVIMLLPFLACFASSLRQGAFVALPVGQQGS